MAQGTATRPGRRRRPDTRGRQSLLTRREAAELAQTSLGAVDKAVEQRTIVAQRGAGRRLFVPLSEIPALVIFRQAQPDVKLPLKLKRKIRDWASTAGFAKGASRELELTPALIVRLDSEATGAVKRACEYLRARDQFIESDPEIKGGAPVITGTRLTTSAVAARLAGGDSMDDIAEDYPNISREALEAAALYGRTHPRQGRPPRPRRR